MPSTQTIETRKPGLRVLDYDECVRRWGGSRRTWDRMMGQCKGPPTVKISERRRGVLEPDFEAWLLTLRLPRGAAAA